MFATSFRECAHWAVLRVVGVLVAASLLSDSAVAQPDHATDSTRAPSSFLAFPGASREITHSHSASRDTALLAYEHTPYSYSALGLDAAPAGWDLGGIRLRTGIFGLLELCSSEPIERADLAGFLPSAGASLWRGQYGFSLAASLESLARARLGQDGAIELALSWRHESDHKTADHRDGSEPEFREVPHMGDFLMLDLAARAGLGRVGLEVRLQHKLFLSHEPDNAPFSDYDRSYAHGPGFDLVLRRPVGRRLRLFSATFGEYLFGATGSSGTRRIPDNYLLRNMTGVAITGERGEIQVYTSIELGHGKGLLAFRKERRLGGGLRVTPF